MRIAAQASSSAPIYFDPTSRVNNYGFNEKLLDGGIICNNPGLYAYLIAKNFIEPNKKKFRVLSLGTGKKKSSDKDLTDTKNFNKFNSLSMTTDFMISFE